MSGESVHCIMLCIVLAKIQSLRYVSMNNFELFYIFGSTILKIDFYLNLFLAIAGLKKKTFEFISLPFSFILKYEFICWFLSFQVWNFCSHTHILLCPVQKLYRFCVVVWLFVNFAFWSVSSDFSFNFVHFLYIYISLLKVYCCSIYCCQLAV
jgi:hypothetical protein